jgi:DNA-binding NarL/FixJ family response regulator
LTSLIDRQVMAVRRVYLVWTHPLFFETVHRLLSHQDVELVGESMDHEAARAEIARLRPDVVVLEEAEGGSSTDLVDFLQAGAKDVQILGLNLMDNELHVYQRRQRTVVHPGDLVDVIRGVRD